MCMARFHLPESSLAKRLPLGRALLRRSARLQIAEQARQGLLIVVVVLPLAEVADVSHAADISSPGLFGLHDRIIQP